MDLQDILGGVLLIAAGVGTMIYANQVLSLGSFRRLGPGAFPMMVGGVVALTGLFILVPAFLRKGPGISFDLRSLLCMLGSVLFFALTIRNFGLIPAVFGSTFIASFTDNRISLLGTLAVATGLSVIVTLVFSLGLRLQAPLLNWPW
jgi:hypothetical protein